jgi:hypothetical protein
MAENKDEFVANLVECPITLKRMVDPVIAADGHTYERLAILEWFEKHARSPVTNMQIGKVLLPNHFAKSLIEQMNMRENEKAYASVRVFSPILETALKRLVRPLTPDKSMLVVQAFLFRACQAPYTPEICRSISDIRPYQTLKSSMNEYATPHTDGMVHALVFSRETHHATWPEKIPCSCAPEYLQPTLTRIQKSFRKLPGPGRNVRFEFQLGFAELEVAFSSVCTRELIVTTPQMMILCQFSTSNHYAKDCLTWFAPFERRYTILSVCNKEVESSLSAICNGLDLFDPTPHILRLIEKRILVCSQAADALLPNDLLVLNSLFPSGSDKIDCQIPVHLGFDTRVPPNKWLRPEFLEKVENAIRHIMQKRKCMNECGLRAEILNILGEYLVAFELKLAISVSLEKLKSEGCLYWNSKCWQWKS